MTEQTYTVGQVAELLGFHQVTIRRHLKSGVIKGVRVGEAGRWRVTQVEINRLCGVEVQDGQ